MYNANSALSTVLSRQRGVSLANGSRRELESLALHYSAGPDETDCHITYKQTVHSLGEIDVEKVGV